VSAFEYSEIQNATGKSPSAHASGTYAQDFLRVTEKPSSQASVISSSIKIDFAVHILAIDVVFKTAFVGVDAVEGLS
jgi:hypothetical protein